jgi:hypothetical protein
MQLPEDAKQVPGHPSYFVTPMGDIYSMQGNKKTLEKLSVPTKRKYRSLNLCCGKRSKMKIINLHRIMAELFIENPNNYPFVLHNDSNPSNNSIENLRWGTHNDNMKDMVDVGHSMRGEGNSHSKLHALDILNIRQLRSRGVTYKELSRIYNVTIRNISYILKNKTWRHIP